MVCNVLVLGLKGAGKSTLILKIGNLGSAQNHKLPSGLEIETAHYKGVTFVSWDLDETNDTQTLQILNKVLQKPIYGLIFVVDSTDSFVMDSVSGEKINGIYIYILLYWFTNHIYIARNELHKYLRHRRIIHTEFPILVLANKQDQKTAISVDDIEYRLSLGKIKSREWKIQTTVLNDDTHIGLQLGMDWLLNKIQFQFQNMSISNVLLGTAKYDKSLTQPKTNTNDMTKSSKTSSMNEHESLLTKN